VSANNVTPPEKIETPKWRNWLGLGINLLASAVKLLVSALSASFIIFLIVGLFRMYLVGGPSWQERFVWGFLLAIVYWATTFPFVLLTMIVYRLIGLPSRFEFLTAISVVGIVALLHTLLF
jgi:hypothetical protein